MSSLDRFNILLERMETLNERSFKSAVAGFSKGEGGINDMLDTYENNGKPITAKSRIRNLLLLRALYHTDYITHDDYEALAKLATSSTKISTLLNQLAPKAQEELFGTAQKSEEVVQYVKDNAEDLLNFGVKNLQGKNFQPREVQAPADEPTENEKEEMKDDVSSAIVSLARELTSDEVRSEVLDFDEADIHIEIPDQSIKRNIASKLANFLNDQGLEAGVSNVGVNVQAPVGLFGDASKQGSEKRRAFRDEFYGQIKYIDPNVPENRVKVKFYGNDYEDIGIEDNEGNPVLDLGKSEVPPVQYPKSGNPRLDSLTELVYNNPGQESKWYMDRLPNLSNYEKRTLANLMRNATESSAERKERKMSRGGGMTRVPAEQNEDQAKVGVEEGPAGFSGPDPRKVGEISNADKEEREDIHRSSDDAFENILSPAIETARQDPDMTYAEVKGMIEVQLGRECTEDECIDIKHDLYHMHGEEGDQERAEAVLGAEDYEMPVTENFENQQHLNVTTNSTSMYLTEQVSKDKRNGSQNKKSSNQSQNFKERYKPKTHWQLEELRRYGL